MKKRYKPLNGTITHDSKTRPDRSECRGCQEIEIAADREIACLNDEIRRLSAKVDAALLVADDHAVARMQKSRALDMFENRRKLAHSLRAESPQVAAFVEAIGVEMDKILKG